MVFSTTRAEAREPLGGQPPIGSRPSVSDLDAQVAYERAFEAIVWAMPASAIYRFRVATLGLTGVTDNTVVAYPGSITQAVQAITPNTVTPYIAAFSDLRNGQVVVELPARTDKASLYGQIVDAWQVTLADVRALWLGQGRGRQNICWSRRVTANRSLTATFPFSSAPIASGWRSARCPPPARPTRMPTPIARR